MSDDRWFHGRPQRTESCCRCKGTGTTRLPYALCPADWVFDSPNDAIRAMVVGSFDIFTACREAADIANASNERVSFQFIDHTVVLAPGDDPNDIARAWWQKQYGETPEESWERR